MAYVDSKNMKILEILHKDARTPNTEIAREIGISEAAVRKRIKKLEAQGIITRYTIEVNPEKIGFSSISLTGIDTEPGLFMSIVQQIRSMEEVRAMYLTSGDHMIMAEIWGKNGMDLSKILTEKIGKLKGVKKVCPAIILEKIK
jgi:Lrp/AsnC family transcriptional regulator for asnA, asnC and gidA